ncbi:MAG: GH92 family glycosyl hydrolase [Hydrotalea sp.]|nr:GH92 family glycosyl hydrolase [Hydrotalea sp.]
MIYSKNWVAKLCLVFISFGLQNSCNTKRISLNNTYTNYVDPFIGTDGTGHTYPGPSLPFGMVQPGPDNRDEGWDYTSGYQFKDSVIMGFSQTRASGTGINEFGDILIQPFTKRGITTFSTGYVKSTEKARPGYYTVTLANDVKVELTCTERVALHRYSYPVSGEKLLLIDFQHGLRFLTDSLVLESEITFENNNTITGYCRTRNWVERKYFFTIQFNQPFIDVDTLPRGKKDKAPSYTVLFKNDNSTLITKIALSTVGVVGAKKNLAAELAHWDFEKIVNEADKKWNKYLSRIDIDASNDTKKTFYSALYRLFLQPSNIADVDGTYRGPDDKIYRSKSTSGAYYSTFSLWDTYRAAHPLYTILVPEMVDDFINSMVQHSLRAGFLPIWTAWGQDNYCMIGNHSIPVITDAFMKGFKGFDSKMAFNEMIKSTTSSHINSNFELLNRYGYYPFDSLRDESVSRTLEHGVDDYAISLFAKHIFADSLYNLYSKRSLYYKNLFNPQTRHMQGKNSKGEWRSSFNPLIATSPMNNPGDYTEANAWQYFWTPAQYDVKGLQDLLGGVDAFEKQLDLFFSTPSLNPQKHLGQEAMIGQYAHGNEPSHHVAYLYAFTRNPDKGKKIIASICQNFYKPAPNGLIGNDDCGQMSAWYIFSMLGFYPVNPANATYVQGLPQIKKATIRNGDKIIEVSQRNNGDLLINGCKPSFPSFDHTFFK